MNTNVQTLFSSITNNIYTTITFILEHKNDINYRTYDHTTFINKYEQIFITNHTNHKLYNLHKYISYITHLDINHRIFTTTP